MYFEGLFLASSSIASAMSNLVPAVTFLIAAIMGLEQVHMKKLSSMAKMLGTIFCVVGAACMAFLRGSKLLNNVELPPSPISLLLNSFGGDDTWLIGCLFIFASMCCWSFWLILQVPLIACYPSHLSLSAWMCFFSMLQSGAIALFLDHDPEDWNMTSNLELTCCFFSGIFGSGVQFFAQAWCISKRGPLYSAMFNPLCTVITTVLACIVLHEELYVGSLLGGVGVIIGLYIVLWGKAKEKKENLLECEDFESDPSKAPSFKIVNDLEQPLLLTDNCKEQV
uniref:WAT1-related protein n=1 Tax=Chenopodium quinoa TaxID=63459 RepID=A0A803MFI8_CHEQI